MGNYMKALIALLALTAIASAQNYYAGNLYGAKVYFFDDDRGYFGLYTSRGDHTPGNIYISKDIPTSWMIQNLAHELCHLRQDVARKPLNEKECCIAAHQGACK